MCPFCNSKGKGPCPLCKSKILVKTLRPRPLPESRQLQMQGKCPLGGCDTSILATLLKTHVDNCEYRGISCSSIPKKDDGGCQKVVGLTELPKHLVAGHQLPLIRVKEEEALLLPVNLPMRFNIRNENSMKLWGAEEAIKSVCPAVVEFGGHYFILHVAVGNYNFYWWLTVFGGQKEANSYKYETQVSKSGDPVGGILYLLPVLPFHRYDKFEKHCWKYAFVHGGSATEYLDNGYLTVKIKMLKTSNNERKGNGGHQNKPPAPLRRGIKR